MKIDTDRLTYRPIVVAGLCTLLLAIGSGCMGEESDPGEISDDNQFNDDEFNGRNNATNGGGANSNNGGNEPPPTEEPEEYEFAEPAIIGHHVYVANETLNSVAIIDSRNLGVRTVLTGLRPTRVVGPGTEGAQEGARVMALNRGSHTVTVIDPEDHSTRNLPVLPGSNQIAMAPGGRHSVVWYDDSEAEPGDAAGDMSAVSIVSGQNSYQLAVGFYVRDVRFDESGERVLIVTNDGVSVVELEDVKGDGSAPPIDLIPASHEEEQVRDFTIEITTDGKYLVAHRPQRSFLLVTEIEEEQTYTVDLPGAPTGMALRENDDEVEVLAVLRGQGAVLRTTVPDGLRAAFEGPALTSLMAQEEEEEEEEEEQNGDENSEEPWIEYEGFGFIDLPFQGPGSVSLSVDGEQAFLFTTIGDEKRAVLLNLEDETTDVLSFEKTIRGVLKDDRGDAFLIFHDREEGSTAGLTPVDPEYVARKWGVTILDVATRARRLILTDLELDDAVLWSPPTGSAVAYMTFAMPGLEGKLPAHRDVLRVNLSSFRKDSFRLASLPDGMGVIPEAEKVFVNQIHPQGRMTFVDVDNNDRQTVTGYQLNAGID